MAGPTGVNELVKFESRTIDLTPEPPKRGSIFGGILQAVRTLSAPAWFFPPVGTAIGASAMGMGVWGDHLQNRSMRVETTAAPVATPAVFPGLGGPAAAGHTPAAFSSDPALSIITARQASINEVPGAIGGK